MKKILFVVTELPVPPLNGVRIPVYMTALALKNKCELHFLILEKRSKEYQSIGNFEVLKKMGEVCSLKMQGANFLNYKSLRTLFQMVFFNIPFFSYMPSRGDLSELKRVILEIRPDVIHFDTMNLAVIGSRLDLDAVKILSANDSLSLAMRDAIDFRPNVFFFEKLLRMGLYLQSLSFEKRIYKKFSLTRMVSLVDASFVEGKSGSRRPNIEVLPNCISGLPADGQFSEDASFSRMIFLGTFNPSIEKALICFIEKILLRLPSGRNTFTLCGRGYSDEFVDYCKGVKFIDIKGFVDDLNSEVCRSSIFINPIRKRAGLFNKYLDVMALGLICIGFKESFGAFSWFKNGEHGMACSSWSDFLNGIEFCQKNPALARKIGINASCAVRRNHDFSTYRERVAKMYLGE